MKILITGAGSYIGISFEKYIKDSGILSSSDFIVNLGDVSDNSEQAQLDEYKKWSEELFAGKPIVNVIGNHDNRNGGVQRFIDTVAYTEYLLQIQCLRCTVLRS